LTVDNYKNQYPTVIPKKLKNYHSIIIIYILYNRMAISRYFLPYTYIAKSQLSSVNCQPKATTAKTRPQFTHRQATSFPATNYQLLGRKLPTSLSRTPPPPFRPIINILYKMATNLCTPESCTDKAQINRKRKGTRITIDRPSHYDWFNPPRNAPKQALLTTVLKKWTIFT